MFDNDLTREYQGVNGKYQLHYDINEANQHTMIVTGEFDHIITASPLLEKISAEKKKRILSNVSDDSYFYQLVLKTEKILTFRRNNLRFRYSSDQHGYSIEYQYDNRRRQTEREIQRIGRDEAGDQKGFDERDRIPEIAASRQLMTGKTKINRSPEN